MTQGDERMKAAKASIRQRLTHSKLPMLVLVGVVLFALIFLGMRFFTRYTREELYRESQNQLRKLRRKCTRSCPSRWNSSGIS